MDYKYKFGDGKKGEKKNFYQVFRARRSRVTAKPRGGLFSPLANLCCYVKESLLSFQTQAIPLPPPPPCPGMSSMTIPPSTEGDGDSDVQQQQRQQQQVTPPQLGGTATATTTTNNNNNNNNTPSPSSDSGKATFRLEVKQHFETLVKQGLEPNDAAALALKLAAKIGEQQHRRSSPSPHPQ